MIFISVDMIYFQMQTLKFELLKFHCSLRVEG
jgi:hypothetical protein